MRKFRNRTQIEMCIRQIEFNLNLLNSKVIQYFVKFIIVFTVYKTLFIPIFIITVLEYFSVINALQSCCVFVKT